MFLLLPLKNIFPSLDMRGIHLIVYILWFPSINKFLSKTLFERISPLISVSLKMCSYSFLWRISFPHSIWEVSIWLFISYDFPLSTNFYRKLFLNEYHHWYLSHLRCVPTPSFEEYLSLTRYERYPSDCLYLMISLYHLISVVNSFWTNNS